MYFKFSILIFCVGVLTQCTTRFAPIRTKPPPQPELRAVHVVDGCVCGPDLERLVSNWADYTAYIEQLKALGCYDLDK